MFAFFKNLHINLNIAIEKRKNFDATIDRETIFVQNIDFFDVAIDKNFDENFEKKIDDSIINFDDTFFERSRTISNANIEKNENFNDIENDEKIDDSKTNETNEINDIDFEICEKNETIVFDFLT